jgi:predicted phage tail protein
MPQRSPLMSASDRFAASVPGSGASGAAGGFSATVLASVGAASFLIGMGATGVCWLISRSKKGRPLESSSSPPETHADPLTETLVQYSDSVTIGELYADTSRPLVAAASA